MKKYILAGLLPLLTATLLLHACYPDPPSTYDPDIIDYTVLPPITQTGANTFGCKINGKVWVPRVPYVAITYRAIDVSFSEKNGVGSGNIVCNLVDVEQGIDSWMQVVFSPTYFNTGDYCYGVDSVYNAAQFRPTTGEWYNSNYRPSSNNCVSIHYLDTVNNIISGTFEFTVHKDTIPNNHKINITEGRFDLRYSPQ
jgi:hypothetical protein